MQDIWPSPIELIEQFSSFHKIKAVGRSFQRENWYQPLSLWIFTWQVCRLVFSRNWNDSRKADFALFDRRRFRVATATNLDAIRRIGSAYHATAWHTGCRVLFWLAFRRQKTWKPFILFSLFPFLFHFFSTVFWRDYHLGHNFIISRPPIEFILIEIHPRHLLLFLTWTKISSPHQCLPLRTFEPRGDKRDFHFFLKTKSNW